MLSLKLYSISFNHYENICHYFVTACPLQFHTQLDCQVQGSSKCSERGPQKCIFIHVLTIDYTQIQVAVSVEKYRYFDNDLWSRATSLIEINCYNVLDIAQNIMAFFHCWKCDVIIFIWMYIRWWKMAKFTVFYEFWILQKYKAIE